MREIKFRAWLNTQKEMLYEDLFGAHIFGGRDCVIMQYTGLKDTNGKEIYEGDIIAEIEKTVYHYVDRDEEEKNGIWVNKEKGLNKQKDFIENVIFGNECKIVEWQEKETGFYPFSDSPENCGHCGGGHNPKRFEVIGNIYQNKELLNT